MSDEQKKRGGAGRGQGRKKSENPKVNITYRIDPALAKWLSSQQQPTRTLEKALKRAYNGDEKIITRAFKAGAKLAMFDYQVDKDTNSL